MTEPRENANSEDQRTGSILVVDDDPIVRALLSRALRADGHEVQTADNGTQALAVLERARVDVVLLDIVMPDLDGIAVLDRIKTDSRLQHLPVIMISGVDDIDNVVHCIASGAEDYLPKPFDPVLLRARIAAGLNKRRIQELEQARLRDTFARFLPESMVDEFVVSGKSTIRLGGVRVIGTAMFTDLRGFTAFAEHASPDEVIEVLNRYLGEMSDAVLDHGGTLVAYMGDGVMAVFGAPVETEDHADRALRAAREMLAERLPRFNAWVRAHGAGKGFVMGVGVCSGPMMSGNVGSERRVEYAAVGDTVNTASRLQSLTRDLPYQLLMAESTRQLLTAEIEGLTFVDQVTLRGKTKPTQLYTLADSTPAPACRPPHEIVR
jgi:adenylate cyclase